MDPAEQNDWAIPRMEPKPQVMTETVATGQPPRFPLEHEGQTHLVPIVLWTVDEQAIEDAGIDRVLHETSHPDRLSVVIPVSADMLHISHQAVISYLQEIQGCDCLTTIHRLADAVEGAFSLGDAAKYRITLRMGRNLKQQMAQAARPAIAALLNAIQENRWRHTPVRYSF